jgi:hypothetical protein
MSEQDSGMGKHPRGTLALVGLYGLVFVIGWLLFLPRLSAARRGHEVTYARRPL